MTKRRTEWTIEIDEFVLVRSYPETWGRGWCDRCAHEVIVVTPERAATITNLTVRTINRMVEAGTVHFTETGDGLLLLCTNSLSKI